MKRIDWLDNARGLGILLVVIGHNPSPLTFAIYSFHMPFFFILSGFLFKADCSISNFIRKKFQTLLVPYFYFSALFFLLWLTVLRYYGNNVGGSVLDNFYGLLFNGGKKNMEWGTHMWFLPCLFFTSLLLFFLIRYTNEKLALFLSFLLSLLFHYFFSNEINRLPFGIDIALYAVFFLALGSYSKKYIFKNYSFNSTILILLTFLFIWIATYSHNVRLDLASLHIGYFPWFIVVAISGSGTLIVFAKVLPANKFLSYLGKKSMLVFILHQTVKSFLYAVISLSLPMLGNEYLHSVSGSICLTALEIIILMPIIYIIEHKLAFMLGGRIGKT